MLYGREPALRLHTTAWFDDPALRRLVAPEAVPSQPGDTEGVASAYPQAGGAPGVAEAESVPTGGGLPSAPTGARLPQEPDMCDHDRSLLSVVPTGPSLLDQLAEVPGTDRYLDVTSGREYTIHHAVDGTPIPVPLEMTEAERAEIDRRSDAFQAELLLLADKPPDEAP